MLFYFSATGNTKHVVENIKLKDETIISIEEAAKRGTYQFQLSESRLGIITPTYDSYCQASSKNSFKSSISTSATSLIPSMWEPTAPPREQPRRLQTR